MPVDWLSAPSAPRTLVDMARGLGQVRLADSLVVGGAAPTSSAELVAADTGRGSRLQKSYYVVPAFGRDQ